MKNNIFLLLFACSLFAASCIKDKGNYDYIDAEKLMPVSISGLRDTTVISYSNLRIEPNVQNADHRHEYTWYIIPAAGALIAHEKQILSNERVLDVLVGLLPGIYNLNLEVRDKELNIYVRAQVKLTVSGTKINDGWYILKDVGNETDFDYVSKTGELFSDVLAAKGEKLTGTAVKIAYMSTRYNHQLLNPDGTLTNLTSQPALHVLSSEDMKTFDPRTLLLWKNFEEQFFGAPSIRNVQSLYFTDMGDMCLLNDSKVYYIYGMDFSQIGKFGVPKYGPQHFFKEAISPFNMGYGTMLFDTLSSTFYQARGYTTTLDLFPNEIVPVIGIPPTNMPYTMLNLMTMGTGNMGAVTGIAVMKNKTDGKHYFVGINYNSFMLAYPFTAFAEIPTGNKMPLAEVKAAPVSGSFVYFGDENKLCAYRNVVAPDRESVLITYAASETISHISHMYSNNIVNPALSYNYVTVLTNSASGWKLYVYVPIGTGNPELQETPVFTASGQGFARHVMYRPS